LGGRSELKFCRGNGWGERPSPILKIVGMSRPSGIECGFENTLTVGRCVWQNQRWCTRVLSSHSITNALGGG
jgi:hypothetical protein